MWCRRGRSVDDHGLITGGHQDRGAFDENCSSRSGRRRRWLWRGAGQGRRRCHLHRPRRASRGDEEQGPQARKPARRHPSRADPGDRRSENRGAGRYRAVLRETVGRRERRRGDQADGGRGYRRDPPAERRRCRRPAGADPGPAGGDGRRRQHQRHHRRARRDPPDRHGPAHGVRRARRQPGARAAKPSPPSAPRPASTACCRPRSRPSSG